MKSERVPSDVIKAIFHFLGEEAHFRFPANIPNIHKAFYTLAQEKDFSILFEDFIFDTSKMFPYCSTIRDALDRLQKSNLLSCINPGLDTFEVSDFLAKYKIEEEELFNREEIDSLKNAARKIKTLIVGK